MNLGNDDDIRLIHASRLHKVDLSDGRSVSVGWSDDGLTVLRLVNNQGTETAFGLHSDAADALKRLLNEGPHAVLAYRMTVSESATLRLGEMSRRRWWQFWGRS